MASPSTAKKAVKCFTLFCAAVCAYAKYNIPPKSPNTATAVIILFFNCLPSYFSVFQAFSHAISCLYGGIVFFVSPSAQSHGVSKIFGTSANRSSWTMRCRVS